MLKWLLRSRVRKVAESDIVEARSFLATMKLKLYKEGPQATRVYGEGVGEMAGLLAQRLCISVPDALTARGLDWQQLDDAARDLVWATEKGRSLLNSVSEVTRTIGHKSTLGCLLLYHLYRLRFLTQHGPEQQQSEAAAVGDRLAKFARIMAEIGAGVRDPADAQEASSQDNRSLRDGPNREADAVARQAIERFMF